MKIIRITCATVLIVASAACACFWWTAFHQQSNLVDAGVQTPAGLKETLPVFSAALDMLKVDIFATSHDPTGVIMTMNRQIWRRILVGVILFLVGIGLLLLVRSESNAKRIALIIGRVVVVILICGLCLLIWWSWYNRNKELPTWKPEYPTNELHVTNQDVTHLETLDPR